MMYGFLFVYCLYIFVYVYVWVFLYEKIQVYAIICMVMCGMYIYRDFYIEIRDQYRCVFLGVVYSIC